MKGSNRLIFLDKNTVVHGTVEASQCIVEGTVVGEINAEEIVHLKMSASVLGDITTQKLLVDEGATHKGELKMLRNVNSKSKNKEHPDIPRPQRTRASSPKSEAQPVS